MVWCSHDLWSVRPNWDECRWAAAADNPESRGSLISSVVIPCNPPKQTTI